MMVTLKHDKDKIKPCTLCYRTFKGRGDYERHTNFVHGKFEEEMAIIAGLETGKITIEQLDLVHSCNTCKGKFLTRNILIHHMKYKHGDLKEKSNKSCKLCHIDFNDKVKYQKHKHSVHNKYKEEIEAILGGRRSKLRSINVSFVVKT